MKESDIAHENGRYWVLKVPGKAPRYEVLKSGLTHSTTDSAYHFTPDGLSIAVARCDYLARKETANAA
jgi:hypothetical protein